MLPTASSRVRKLLRGAELLALPLCRFLPTLAVTLAVALQPAQFATRARWGWALYGLAHMNAVNAWKACQSFGGRQALRSGPKAHDA